MCSPNSIFGTTGSTALLIEGMTIHSSLGIQIQKKGRGKGNRDAGSCEEDYVVVISVKKWEQI